MSSAGDIMPPLMEALSPSTAGAASFKIMGGSNFDRASVESSVFSSVSSLGQSHDSELSQISGDVFREFSRIPLYRELPPRLRKKSPLELLPDEVLQHLLGKLSPVELCRVGTTCTQLHKWSADNKLWEQLCRVQWGVDFVGTSVYQSPLGVKDRAWKAYFVERQVTHRQTMASASLSMQRMRIADGEKESQEMPKRET